MNEGEQYATRWIAAWNSLDLERALALWADDVEFSSPLAFDLTGQPVLRGKTALEAYWRRALAMAAHLKFELIASFWDPEARTVTILYWRERAGDVRLAAEIALLDGKGLGRKGYALHGAPLR